MPRRTARPTYRTLRDGSFEGRFPGTSCQATIVLSLRDAEISRQHPAEACCECPGGRRAQHTVPYGTVRSRDVFQALRARLRSCCPYGTQRFRDSIQLKPVANAPEDGAPNIPYPTGRFVRGTFSRHFVPGYDRVVPTGRRDFATASS